MVWHCRPPDPPKDSRAQQARGASPLSRRLMAEELLPCSGRRLGQEQGVTPNPASPYSARQEPALTCLVCMEPQDAGMGVFQGPT